MDFFFFIIKKQKKLLEKIIELTQDELSIEQLYLVHRNDKHRKEHLES
jgi:late competence protein required for DNA uptake (superfamily II DNA/RNA helicase)